MRLDRCRRCEGTGHTISLCSAESSCDACSGSGQHTRVVALIQARLGSSRFPRKVLAQILGKPMLQHVYDRACRIAGVHDVRVIAPVGDTFPGVCAPMWRPAVSAEDVHGRYPIAADWAQADELLRLTGDCPVLDPALCTEMLTLFLTNPDPVGLEYLSNDWRSSGYPSGLDCEIFTREALDEANAIGNLDPYDREHVTPWLKRWARSETVRVPVPWAGPAKLSVDTPEDLAAVTAWLGGQPSLPPDGVPTLVTAT